MSARNTSVVGEARGRGFPGSQSRRSAWRAYLATFVTALPLTGYAQPIPDPMLAPGDMVPTLSPAPIQAIPAPMTLPNGGYLAPSPTPAYAAPTYAAPQPMSSGAPYSGTGGGNMSVPIRPFAPVGPFEPRPPMDRRITGMPTNTQKLEVINHRSQLVLTKDAVTRMAWSDPSIIDIVQFSEKEFSILGSRMGTTDLWLWFKDQAEPLMYTVTVIRDPSLEDRRRIDYGRIERKLALLYPNSKVYLIPLSYKIIVRGQAKDTSEAANIMNVVRGEVIAEEGRLGQGSDRFAADLAGGDLGGAGGGGLDNFGGGFNGRNNDFLSGFIVNEMQVPGEFQIGVRVRIAEVRRSQLRRWGMNINVLFNDARHAITAGLGAVPVLSGVFENGEIAVLIDALNQNGSARVLEDTSLTVMSGESAAFLSGGEFAVPTTILGGGAVGAATTSFRGFGTSVIATPTVVDNDLIRLQIIPELSSINAGNSVNGIFGLNVRRVQTRVELREGQTIVLGGLFSRAERGENNRVPLLGEIPGIGSLLFNEKRLTEDEIELLIIVTPEILRPMDADQTPPLPGFYVTQPDDIDFCYFNRIEGNPDLSHYQLLPYGNGNGVGQNVGYNFYQPNPQGGQLSPPANGGMNPGGPNPGGMGPGGYDPGPYTPGPNGYGPNPGQFGPGPGQSAPVPVSSNGRSGNTMAQPGYPSYRQPAIQQTSGTDPRRMVR